MTGASRGIGAAVARALDEQGVRLGLASRSGSDLGIEGRRRPDVRRPRSRPGRGARRRDGRALRTTGHRRRERRGRAYGLFLELQPDVVEEMIDVNVKGLLYTVRAVLPHLIAGASLADAVRVGVFLREMRNFTAMDAISRAFFAGPRPARTTIQSALPGFEIEVDAVLLRER